MNILTKHTHIYQNEWYDFETPNRSNLYKYLDMYQNKWATNSVIIRSFHSQLTHNKFVLVLEGYYMEDKGIKRNVLYQIKRLQFFIKSRLTQTMN